MSGKFVGAEQRDPQLPTSVPMPSVIEDIADAGMRAMWETAGSVQQSPAQQGRPHFPWDRTVSILHPCNIFDVRC